VTIAEQFVRRNSYGPTSPIVGERGARTRRAIVSGALDCFEATGFHGTSVEDIAAAVGISRAALYQYFENKEQLFGDLVETACADLLRLIGRLGALGPTPSGYDNLHWWLGEWAWVQDKYRGVFLEWAVVDAPGAPAKTFMEQFVASASGRLSARLAATAGAPTGLDMDDVAVALLGLLLRVNDFRQRGFARGLTDDGVLAGVATAVQYALFPTTPASVISDFAATRTPESLALGGWQVAGERPGNSPARTPRSPRPQPDPERFGNNERVLQTVERLLDAGATVFATRGYQASTVADIRSEAGVARGTFYRYFDDKEALLATLAEDCAVRLASLVARLDRVLAEDEHRSAALRNWLHEYIEFHRRYRSVLRAWTEQDLAVVAQTDLGFTVAVATVRTFDHALGRIERRHPFDVRVGSIMLLAMLESVPGYSMGTDSLLTEDRVVDVLAAFISRGLLGDRTGLSETSMLR
jgi:AcrR family transcriptional regulator